MEIEEDNVHYASEAETVPCAFEACEETKTGCLPVSMDEEDMQSQISLQRAMLDHLASNEVAHFKSQQVEEPELSFEQKRQIAEDILKRSPGQFLSRFGHYLQAEHLDYFRELDMKAENYEVAFHLKRLRRFHCKVTNEVDVKNRRFEALKKLVKEGQYFSEKEMKQRNPLLYQQLIGQYLTRKEVEDQKNSDRAAIDSWVNLMLAQIERDQMLCLRKRQQDDEDGAVEEMDTSDEEGDSESEFDTENESYDEDDKEENNTGSCSSDEDDKEKNNERNCSSDKGDEDKSDKKSCSSDKDFIEKNNKRSLSSSKNAKKRKHLSGTEKNLLREEFISNMYRSFLEGRDVDFDYSQVDLNPEYECLALRSQDEEEKYFDSETPELVRDEQGSAEEEEDELDVYMKNLKPEPTASDLAVNLSVLL